MNIKKKYNKKIKEVITPKQLQYWLVGVLEFQPNDWVPTLDQWELIRNKINSLDTTLVTPEENILQCMPQSGHNTTQTNLPNNAKLMNRNYTTDITSMMEDNTSTSTSTPVISFDDQLADTHLDTTNQENMKPIGEPLIGSQLKSGIIDVAITDTSGSRSSFA